MGFADSHVHFHFPDFDQDREAAMDRARHAGITHFINIGTDVESSRKSIGLAEQYLDVWAAVGIHPHDAKEATPEIWNEIEKQLQHPRVVAIGEIGLDFYRNLSPEAVQLEVLRRFIEIQKRIRKPLILHCRDAYEALYQFLKDAGPSSCQGILHCFSSDKETMKKFLDLGFYISFAGPLTYKKNDVLRDACRSCPVDRLILETDAPFLPPQTKRGKRNESSFMLETAEVAASLHHLSLNQLGDRTTANTASVLRLC